CSVIILACSASVGSYAQRQSRTFSTAEDARGQLHVPPDYRERYEDLGAWSAAAQKTPGAQQLHIVYASPGTRAAYKRTGEFPGGTVLVKEQLEAATAQMTSGIISHEQ